MSRRANRKKVCSRPTTEEKATHTHAICTKRRILLATVQLGSVVLCRTCNMHCGRYVHPLGIPMPQSTQVDTYLSSDNFLQVHGDRNSAGSLACLPGTHSA